jgi:26S proteasome regulatory subunit N12
LTQSGLLVPSPQDATNNTDQVVLAREVLEIGAFWSLKQKDIESFDRYVGLLRVFYTDLGCVLEDNNLLCRVQSCTDIVLIIIFSSVLPPSKSLEPLLGLSLLRLLSANLISQFHTTLETLPPNLVASSPYIQHPVNLERWLMEGSYSKVWRARQEVPREEYSYFVEELMGTIR